jgi:hypothetical protein
MAGRPENVKLTPQEKRAFNVVPNLVKDDTRVYVMQERCSLKSVIFGADGFKIKDAATKDTVLKLKQTSLLDFGQDKMVLVDKVDDTPKCIIRRARLSFRSTFYIYTLEKPYPEAEYSNEEIEVPFKPNQKLYCWGYMSTASGFNCVEDYEVGYYYYDPATCKPGKDHPYKPLYIIRCWRPMCDKELTIGYMADESGGVKKKSEEDPGEAIFQVERDAFQWDEANCYGLQVASGVDAGLCVLICAIIDECREDANDDSGGGFD